MLNDAQLQIETEEQRDELRKVLKALESNAELNLFDQLFADYAGVPNQWSALKTLSAYFHFETPLSIIIKQNEPLSASSRSSLNVWSTRALEALAPKCIHHPGRPSYGMRFGKAYCAQCISGIDTAGTKVDKHVIPRECFVTYKSGDTWAAIDGTGCAHWVAHQRNVSKSSNLCSADCTLRVPDLIMNTSSIARAGVSLNDIWANNARNHCGLVVKVEPLRGTPPNKITIRHDSSEQGGVFENDFDTYFKGAGTFHR